MDEEEVTAAVAAEVVEEVKGWGAAAAQDLAARLETAPRTKKARLKRKPAFWRGVSRKSGSA